MSDLSLYKSEPVGKVSLELSQYQADNEIEDQTKSIDMASFVESILEAKEKLENEDLPALHSFFPYWNDFLNKMNPSSFDPSFLYETDFCTFLLKIALQDADIELQLHSFITILLLMKNSPNAIDIFIENNITYYAYQWLSDKNQYKKQISCGILSQCLDTENGFMCLAKMEVIPKLLIIFDSYLDLPSNQQDKFTGKFLELISEIHLKLLTRINFLPEETTIQISRLFFKALNTNPKIFYSTVIESTCSIVNEWKDKGLKYLLDDEILPRLNQFGVTQEIIELYALIFSQPNIDLKNIILKQAPIKEFKRIFLTSDNDKILHPILAILTNCLALDINLYWILETPVIDRFIQIFEQSTYHIKETAIRFFMFAAYKGSGPFLQALLDSPVMLEAIQNIPSLTPTAIDSMLKCLNKVLMKIDSGDAQATPDFDACVIDTLKALMNIDDVSENQINCSELAQYIYQSYYPQEYYEE